MKITAVSAAFAALAAVMGTVNAVPMPPGKPTSTGLSDPFPLVDINGTHTMGYIIPLAANVTRPPSPRFTFTQTITVTVPIPTDLSMPWEVMGNKGGNKTRPIYGPPGIHPPPKAQPESATEISRLNLTDHHPKPKWSPLPNPFTNPKPQPKPKVNPWVEFTKTGPIPTARPTLIHEHGRPLFNGWSDSKPNPGSNKPPPSLVHDHSPNPEPEVSETGPVTTTATTTSSLLHDHAPPNVKPSGESVTQDDDKPVHSLHHDHRPNPEVAFTETAPIATASTTSTLFHDHSPPHASPAPKTATVEDHHKHGGPISIRTGPAIEGFETVTRVKCIAGEAGGEDHDDEAVAYIENFTCNRNLDISPCADSKLHGDAAKYCFDNCECQQHHGGKTDSPKDMNQPRRVEVDPKFAPTT
ncbi:uncharacterized protein DNG_07922 [Cephalotrichum gorgonifer]|uniref:Uncharacterized protein n=1 Tax=Cephalotrichum gorgonifer TaxID=2041049 RepID=A0AAE8SXW5_9PEZI|nr:uncharacterized protein DNG_07922 [Cephalotrichum gorgonifer]